jgi:prepilin-type N-terminal cleavage/methylation domain-containing protein
MLNKLKKPNNRGFTIIEVMIVLAIAGLIILIVLLAVPALQRNSRNTAIKNDATALAAAITEFQSNNDGVAPTAAGSSQTGSSVTINNASGTQATAKVQGSTVVHFESAATPTAANYAVGNIDVDYGYKCTSSTSTTLSAQPRSTAVLYSVETSSSSAPRCVDS